MSPKRSSASSTNVESHRERRWKPFSRSRSYPPATRARTEASDLTRSRSDASGNRPSPRSSSHLIPGTTAFGSWSMRTTVIATRPTSTRRPGRSPSSRSHPANRQRFQLRRDPVAEALLPTSNAIHHIHAPAGTHPAAAGRLAQIRCSVCGGKPSGSRSVRSPSSDAEAEGPATAGLR